MGRDAARWDWGLLSWNPLKMGGLTLAGLVGEIDTLVDTIPGKRGRHNPGLDSNQSGAYAELKRQRKSNGCIQEPYKPVDHGFGAGPGPGSHPNFSWLQ